MITVITEKDTLEVFTRSKVQWMGSHEYAQEKGKFYIKVRRLKTYYYFTCDTQRELTSIKITKSCDFDAMIKVNNRRQILEMI